MVRFREHHLVLCLLVAAAVLRVFPHPGNIAAIGALALFAGAYLQHHGLWLIPLAALLLGDAARGQTQPIIVTATAIGFLTAAAFGRQLLQFKDSWRRICLAVVIAASACWASVTLGQWLAFHSLTIAGALDSVAASIHLLPGQLIGDAGYAFLLFGIFSLTRELPFVHFTPMR
jgi:hypothetical protein